MKASLFYLPSIGSRAEIEAGMAGMKRTSTSGCWGASEQMKLGDDWVTMVSYGAFHMSELSNNDL